MSLYKVSRLGFPSVEHKLVRLGSPQYMYIYVFAPTTTPIRLDIESTERPVWSTLVYKPE
jgi:hypothetical protein